MNFHLVSFFLSSLQQTLSLSVLIQEFMATHLQLTVLTIFILASFCMLRTSAATAMEASDSASPPSPLTSQELQDLLSPRALLESILTKLGFQELATTVLSLSDSPDTTWNGPLTLFAPTDASIRSCRDSCSVPNLLREHIVPGIFSLDILHKLAFGTKLETMSPGRCITVTSAYNNNNTKIIFVGGVEITHPDLFYNGLIVVHRLEGFISPLSPSSCNIERMNSLSFPPQPSISDSTTQSLSASSQAIMRLMLKDSMLRLHNNGFIILSLAMRVKYAELVNLQNMTVFTLDDASIFSGGQAYISNVRFHIVPNRLLMHADLVKLPVGTRLATLERDQTLVITTAGGGGGGGAGVPMRINYIRIKSPDMMYNLKIVVHSVFLPFPHLRPAAAESVGVDGSTLDADAAIGDGGTLRMREGGENVTGAMGSCAASEKEGGCLVGSTPESKATVQMEEQHGQ